MTVRRLSHTRFARDLDDWKLLAGMLVLVPATWWLLLGWSWASSVSGFDGLATNLPMLGVLTRARGDWTTLVYRADLFGGMEVRDSVGPLPLFSWLARLGLSATGVVNWTTFLVQAVIGFLGLRAARDLAALWSPRSLPPTWIVRLAGAWLCAFAPALGWRVGHGHQSLILGGLPFLAGLALLASAAAGTRTLTLVLVATAAMTNGILFTGHQTVLYGIIFGGPILLGLWMAAGRRPQQLAWAAVVCAGAFLLALPSFSGVLAHAFSSDSIRNLTGVENTYSYLTARPLDWLSSIPWGRQFIPSGRPDLHHHETNIPAGPLLLLLALVPWRRARPLAVGLGASVALALAFSMNLRPVSDALLLALPPLGSFRVPTRAMLPAVSALPVIVLAGALSRARPPGWRATLAALAGSTLLFLLPGLARELAGWALAAAVAVPIFRGAREGRALLTATAVVIAVSGGSLSAFRERLPPYVDGGRLLARATTLGLSARRARPELVSALDRVTLGSELPGLGANTSFAAGLSSLDGYYFPGRRFVELVCAVRHQSYSPNALLLRFPEWHPSSRALFQLYNVRWGVEGTRGRGDRIEELSPTAGPAWFSSGLSRVDSYAELARLLLARGDTLYEELPRRLWLVDDPLVDAARLPESVPAECSSASVARLEVGPGGGHVVAKVSTTASCPLSFALSYNETLRAVGVTPRGGEALLSVFPAYGALAGVWVPKGTSEVRINTASGPSNHAGTWYALGTGLLIFAWLWARRNSSLAPLVSSR